MGTCTVFKHDILGMKLFDLQVEGYSHEVSTSNSTWIDWINTIHILYTSIHIYNVSPFYLELSPPPDHCYNQNAGVYFPEINKVKCITRLTRHL